ncbi:MAG TPA: TetR/AcrR family transcriptional regulator [Thermomicrobiales bacterium]
MSPTPDTAQILSPEERRQRNREEVRQMILDASRAVMREQGVAALSLREVARRIRMQAPSLYAYFPSKMALYDALFAIGVRLYASYRLASDDPRDDVWGRLRALLETYMRFAQENPDLYQLAIERPVPGFVPSEESLRESFGLLPRLEGILADAVAAGQIVLDVPIPQARDLVIAVAHGLTSQHMANEPQAPVGVGRYGGLIPAALALFRAAWAPRPGGPVRTNPGEPGEGQQS